MWCLLKRSYKQLRSACSHPEMLIHLLTVRLQFGMQLKPSWKKAGLESSLASQRGFLKSARPFYRGSICSLYATIPDFRNVIRGFRAFLRRPVFTARGAHRWTDTLAVTIQHWRRSGWVLTSRATEGTFLSLLLIAVFPCTHRNCHRRSGNGRHHVYDRAIPLRLLTGCEIWDVKTRSRLQRLCVVTREETVYVNGVVSGRQTETEAALQTHPFLRHAC